MAIGSGGFIPISFQVDGQKEINRKLATWGAKIESLEPAWEQVGQDLLGDFLWNFGAEGGTLGTFIGGAGRGKWAPLKPATVQDRLRKGFTYAGGRHPILWRTGDLLRSVSFRGAPGNVFEVGPNSLVVGSDWFSARWHQYGTYRMPARPIVGVSRKRATRIVRTLNEYVMQMAQQQGLQAG